MMMRILMSFHLHVQRAGQARGKRAEMRATIGRDKTQKLITEYERSGESEKTKRSGE